MSEHTKEPWFVADWNDDNGGDLTTIEAREPEELFEGQSHIWPDGIAKKKVADTSDGNNPPEDARRIVACVNACAGLPTDYLEQTSMLGLSNSYHAETRDWELLERQRDELLAALKSALSASEGDWNNGAAWDKKARAAIANVKDKT